MKKLFYFTLFLIILISCLPFSVSAYDYPEPPYDRNIIEDSEIALNVRNAFKGYLLDKCPAPDAPIEEYIETEVYCTQDEVAIFFGCYGDMSYSGTSMLIGQYVFFGRDVAYFEGVNPLGLYALKKDGTVIPLPEAFEEGIADIEDFASHYPKSTRLPDREYDIITKLGIKSAGYRYKELFTVYEGEANATPDYILVDASQIVWHNDIYTEKIGDYIIESRLRCPKDHLPYYIYLANGELLTLREATDRGIDVIEQAVFPSDIPLALSGDSDGDGKLTVKDSTRIQKKLAGFRLRAVYDEFLEYAADDFDGDNNLTVRDATAIQKKIAGIGE